MLSYKFIIDGARENALRLRLTNNRRKVEVSLGLQMTEEELADSLSEHPAPRNRARRGYLLGVMAKLEDVRMMLNEQGRSDEDVRVIKGIVCKDIFNRETQEEQEAATNNFVGWFVEFAETHDATGGIRTRLPMSIRCRGCVIIARSSMNWHSAMWMLSGWRGSMLFSRGRAG